MCTNNSLFDEARALRNGPPTVIKAYKALKQYRWNGSFCSGYHAFGWGEGWNKAKNPLDRLVEIHASVNEGAIHVALTPERALSWVNGASAYCNAVIEVQISSCDIIAMDDKGECAAAQVYVPKLINIAAKLRKRIQAAKRKKARAKVARAKKPKKK